MSRWTSVLLVVCAIFAFLLPLTGRWVLAQYQDLSSRNVAHVASTATVATQGQAEQRPGTPGVVAQASWSQPVPVGAGTANPSGTVPHPLDDMGKLVLKITVATAAVLGLCVVCLQFGGSVLQGQPSGNNELQVCESIHLSKEASVKLIKVGDQKVVVTHDRQGVRGMVLLPNESTPGSVATAFQSAVNQAQSHSPRSAQFHDAQTSNTRRATATTVRPEVNEDPYSVASLRRRLANTEEHGWDLNQQTF